MVVIIEGNASPRAFGPPDAPWLIDAGDLDRLSDTDLQALSGYGVSLVVDVREDAAENAVRHGFPVKRNPIPAAAPGASTTDERIDSLLTSRAHEITSAVGAIASADGPVLVHGTAGEESSSLVMALALLAAGAPVGSLVDEQVFHGHPDDPDSGRGTTGAVAHILHVLNRYNGVECYLLRHGLSIEQFHSLRDKYQELHDEP